MQLHEVEDDLQTKDKCISQLEASLKAKQTQLPQTQAEKESSDAATQFVYADVAECKLGVFHAKILKNMSVHFHR